MQVQSEVRVSISANADPDLVVVPESNPSVRGAQYRIVATASNQASAVAALARFLDDLRRDLDKLP